jgi:ubiquinone/menaquinone biosynthesis C-methylase UbiE
MEYIGGGKPALKYTGATAAGYDAKREKSEKWTIEQKAIEGMLEDLPIGDWILDAPCGTGRFFEFYHRQGFIVRALDISPDMLSLAAQKCHDHQKFRFAQGDVRNTGLEDKSVDAAVMCRLTRWLTPQECQEAIKELARVARKRIIITARIANHPHARPVELFEEALEDWELYQNEPGYQEDYRILQFRPIERGK